MKQFSIVALLLLLSSSTIHAQDYSTIRAKDRRAKDRRSDFPRFRFTLQGGWSYRLAKVADDIPAAFKQYYKNLKPGFNLGADAGYFFTQEIGVGLKYAYYHAGNELSGVSVTDESGQTRTGLMKNQINIHYIAPAFYYRFATESDKLVFLAGASIGYLRYIDNGVLVDSYNLTGGTVGLGFEFGADYMITEHFAIGANIGLIGGSLSKVKMDNGTTQQEIELEEDNRENLSRLDLSAGVRWYF